MKVGEFTMASKRRINCKFCVAHFYDPDEMVAHIEKEHPEQIPSDMTPWRFFYYLKTGNATGSCIVCKKPTPWNEKTHKYSRYCGNPKCKEKYVKTFQSNMIGTYGKTHLLNDPERQKLMLSRRRISGEYIWSTNPNYKFLYTGSYERSFLEFLDKILFFNPDDIMAPSPHTYYYMYENKKHFYIPDFFIPSLGLEIEIKDGGDNPNTHGKIQAVDKVKERLKDEVMSSNRNTFNYLKIVNKENEKFLKYLEVAKYNFINDIKSNIVML